MAASISTSDLSPRSLSDPERLLALSYAPAAGRDRLALLWQIDERMGAIVAAAREPTIGAMRLIWWRDALARLDEPGLPAPAEPLLSAAAECLLPAGLPGRSIAAIEEGWAALLEDAVPGEAQIIAHGEGRGGPLFALSAALLGAVPEDVGRAGEGWALADLGHRLRDPDARPFARAAAAERLGDVAIDRWPATLRPLGLLVLFARMDAALPSERQRRQGSPKRMFRALAYRLTGR
nr:squalene/phytoene synthase family protein [Sphingomonas sp. Y57]